MKNCTKILKEVILKKKQKIKYRFQREDFKCQGFVWEVQTQGSWNEGEGTQREEVGGRGVRSSCPGHPQ